MFLHVKCMLTFVQGVWVVRFFVAVQSPQYSSSLAVLSILIGGLSLTREANYFLGTLVNGVDGPLGGRLLWEPSGG